ncbi:MAG: phosphodiester glycosidase family protein [Bacteroidetes bacterium]|nr:MAG: phosphodiester glycosidase family protein [Bacteroidota bacterium]
MPLLILSLFISSDFILFNGNELFAKVSLKKKLISKKKLPIKKSLKISPKIKSKGKKGRTRYSTKFSINIATDSILSDGIKYKHIYFVKGKLKHSVHVLEADLMNPGVDVAVLKAKGLAFELEKLHDMIHEYDSINHTHIFGGVNGNFWRAFSNTPIGPTVIDGEVIEMKTHKKWSSCFFDEYSRMTIDNFFMDGILYKKGGQKFSIGNVNRRLDSLGVVMYNKFGGDTIPYITKRELDKALMTAFETAIESALQDTLFNDTTEVPFDTVSLRYDLTITNRLSKIEHSLKKIRLKYIDKPLINKEWRCVVTSIDTGIVAMPENGCIISFGMDAPANKIPKIKDTLFVKFSTNLKSDIRFYNSVAGTPRLVRNGLARHEAYEEGSRGRRFIGKQLSRTAIGTDKSRSKIYLVAVETTIRSEGKIGATLKEMSGIMRQIGAYNAMNLDGGGSTIMVIGNKNIFYKSRPEISRRLSVGIAIVKKRNSTGSN